MTDASTVERKVVPTVVRSLTRAPSKAAAADASSSAAAKPTAAPSTASELIRIEGEIRALTSSHELALHLVNEIGAVVACDQALVFRADAAAKGAAPRWRLEAAASLATVQREAPLVRWLDELARAVHAHEGTARVFSVADHAKLDDPSAQHMALAHGLWLPMPDHHGRASMAAMLLAKQPWESNPFVIARRMADAYAHAQLAITGRSVGVAWHERLHGTRWKVWSAGGALVAAALGLVHVPLSTLSPVEVAPSEPFVVAAPVPGVVERLLVEPGAEVKAGEPLVQLVDTSLRNEFEVSTQRLGVARARTLRVQQAAVDDPAAKRELAIAQTEQAVAQAERDFAQAMLAKSVLSASIDGVALFGDARDWMGRPVAVGEAILRVADASKTEFQLRVPVADAVNVRVGLPVQVFLDADPLDPRHAVVTRVAYKAEADAAGVASFLVTARLEGEGQSVPQLGMRGTAQVRGEDVSLFYYLFRRPLTAVRQTLGL